MMSDKRIQGLTVVILLCTILACAGCGRKPDPEKMSVTVSLYFADEDMQMLREEARTLEVFYTERLPLRLVKEILRGPEEEGHKALISPDVAVLRQWIFEDTMYIDFDESFLHQFVGTDRQGELTIYSIVNTMTQLPGIEKVQLLIDGKRINEYPGHVNIQDPLEREESLISNE